MTLPAHHLAFDVHEPSQVGAARRAAVHLADCLGFDEVAAGRVAIVATELGNNLVRHAQRGRLLLGAVDNDAGERCVELLSIDHGPGIADLAASMADGYSTGGTPGTGLGAVRRLSGSFDVFSEAPGGTVIMARIDAKPAPPHATARAPRAAPAPSFVIGSVALAAPGETVCGDAWAVAQHEGRAALFMADGLGHGPGAAEAANEAVRGFEAAPFAGSAPVLERVHAALRRTRGAAVALAQVDAAGVVFAGAGNIAGRLISGVGDRSLVSQHGTAGVQMRRVQEMRYDWPAHALLVMHSDGLVSRWSLDATRGLLQHHPTVVAAWLLREHLRGRDDTTVVILKRREA